MPSHAESLHCLLVEHDSSLRTTVSRLLHSFAVRTTGLKHGGEARDWLDSNHCDFVLTDLDMPTMDGLQLLSWVHEHQPGLPCIIMTGTLHDERKLAAINRGAIAVLPKPFELHELTDALSSVQAAASVAKRLASIISR